MNPLQRMRRERRLACALVLAFVTAAVFANLAGRVAAQLFDLPRPPETTQDASP